MKIAQVTPVYPPYRGGMGSVAYEYTERLRALGHEVEVFTPAWKIGNAGFFSPQQLRRLNAFDVVHLHYPLYGGAEQVALFCRRPIVLTYHMDARARGIKGLVFRLHRTLIQPLILLRAKKILVSSLDYAAASALRRFRRLARLVELPFGVDIRRFHPVATGEEAMLRTQLAIPANAPVLVFVGGLDTAHAFKGVPTLLQSFLLLSPSFSAHLVIIGDGDLRAGFEASVSSDRVHFVGSRSPEELPTCYRLATMHLFPSTSSAEAFGLVALEAAASGIPTIASDLPGVRTVVKDGQTGLLVPPGDASALTRAIDQLLNDEVFCGKLGANARKRVVEEYDWDRLLERLITVYEDCHHH